MNEVLEYKGYWWLPEQPDNEVFGIFSFTPQQGITLELEGKLHPSFDRNFNPDLILGITKSGEHVTILNCQLTNQTHSLGNTYEQSSLVAEMAFKGKGFNAFHFESTDIIKFRRLTIRYAHLDEWLSDYIADFDIDTTDFPKNHSMTVQYQPSQAATAEFDGYKLALGVKYTSHHSIRKQVTIKQHALAEISFSEAKSLDDCFYFIYQIRNFLTLGLSVPTYPLQVIGLTETDQYIDFLYSQPHLPQNIRLFDSRNVLFSFPAIQENFQTYFANWFSRAEPLKPVYDLYFSARYNPHEYLQSTFLSLTQALETYHRRRYGGVYLANEEYKQKVYPKLAEAIPAELGNDFKQSLKKGTLQYANQFSLRKRLKDMTTELSEQQLGITFLYTRESRENFVGKVCDIRNYLTHYDPDSHVDVSSKELLDLTEKLIAILEIYLLKEIGFDFVTVQL